MARRTSHPRTADVMTPAAIAAMPTGPDKAEVMAFWRFLLHHPSRPLERGSSICTCGIAARLEADGTVSAVPNPNCDCPCHEDGYAVGKTTAHKGK